MAKGLNMKVLLGLQTKAFNKGVADAKKQLSSLGKSFTSFASTLGAGIGFAKFVSGVKETTMELSSAQSVLKNVSKSVEEYGKTQEWVRNLAKTYKQDIIGLTTNFAKFKASADQCNVSMEDQKKIYESLVRAASFYHLSTEETNSAILAVQQMMSKGKVTAEELRKQLGNVLPSAFGLMAKAADASTAELEKMMSAGKLLSGEVLPKFADELNKVTQNLDLDTLEGAVNSLKNAWTEFVESMEVSGIIKGTYNTLAGMLNFAKKNINDLIVIVKTLAEVWFAGKLIKAIKNVKVALTGLSTGNWITALVTGITLVINKLISAKQQVKEFNKALGNAMKETDVLSKKQKLEDLKKEAELKRDAVASRTEYETAKYRQSHEGSYKGMSVLQPSFDKKLIQDYEYQDRIVKNINEELNKIEPTVRQLANGEFYKVNDAWNEYVAGVNKLNNQKANGASVSKSSYNELEKNLVAAVGGVIDFGNLDSLLDNYGQTPTFVKDIKALIAKWGRQPIKVATSESDAGNAGGGTTEIVDAQKEAFKSLHETLTSGKLKLSYLKGNGIDTSKSEMEFYANLAEAMKELGLVPETLDKYIAEGETWASELKDAYLQGNNMGTTAKIWDLIDTYNQESTDAAERIALNIGDASEKVQLSKKFVEDIVKELQNAGIKLDLSDIEVWSDTKYDKENNSFYSTGNTEFNNQIGERVGEAIGQLNLPQETAKALKDLLTELLGNSIREKDYIVSSSLMASGDAGGRDKTFDYRSSGKEWELMAKDVDFTYKRIDEIEGALKDLESATGGVYEDGTLAWQAYNMLSDEMQNCYKSANDLAKKATLGEIKADVEDLEKEMKNLTIDGVGGVIDGISSIYNSFQSLESLWEDEDASPFEIMIKSLQTLWSVFETVNGVIETFNSLKEVSVMLSKAQAAAEAVEAGQAVAGAAQVIGAKATETAAVETTTAAKAGEAVAGASSSVASIPIVGAALAVAAAIAIAAAMKSNMGKFANGGIIGGNSYSGDKLTANVNSGEMILNKGQQSTLFNAINSGNLGGGNVEFKIRGADLIGTINNYNSRRRG